MELEVQQVEVVPSDITYVQIQFFTRLGEEHQLPDDSPLDIPTSLQRYGLSEVINRLLDRLSDPVPYDFIVEGTFLRSTLKSVLAGLSGSGRSGETILHVEYILAMKPICVDRQNQHPDWVSAVCCIGNSVWTGSYDSCIRLWDIESEGNDAFYCFQAHTKPITAISPFYQHPYVLTASRDGLLNIWSNEEKNQCVYVCKGHNAAVECCATFPEFHSSLKFVSGSWDHTLQLWSVDLDGHDRPRGLKENVIAPSAGFDAHSEKISSVCWPHALALYSAGYDRVIKQWDIQRGSEVINWAAHGVTFDLTFSHHANILASAHDDRRVRLWDPRVNSGNNSAKIRELKAHKGFVTAVKFCPDNSLFASAGRDGCIKIWDMRSSIALQSIQIGQQGQEDDVSVLCLDWQSDKAIVSGSDDSSMRVHVIS